MRFKFKLSSTNYQLMFLHILKFVLGPTPEVCCSMLNLIRHYIFCILWFTARDIIFLLLIATLAAIILISWLSATAMDSSEYIRLTVFALMECYCFLLKIAIDLCTIDRAYIIPPCLEEEIYPVGNLAFGGRGPGISQRTDTYRSGGRGSSQQRGLGQISCDDCDRHM